MKAVLMLGIVLLLAASTTACATQGGRGDGIQASPRTDQASPHSDRSQPLQAP